MSTTSYAQTLTERVQELQLRYAHALDEDRLEDWPDFFADGCRYQVIPRENHARGLPACLIDCRGRAAAPGNPGYQPRPEFTQKFTDSEVVIDSTWWNHPSGRNNRSPACSTTRRNGTSRAAGKRW